MTDTPTAKVGDWVAITARVVELHPNHVDLRVDLSSHATQYPCWVRRALCTPVDGPIADEPLGGSVALLTNAPGDLNGAAFQLDEDHYWYRAGESGIARTWRELNLLGDVKVIHHA